MSHSLKNFWVSWYGAHGAYTLDWPWWVVGHGMGGGNGIATICAAVQAKNADAAKKIVWEGHDLPPQHLEFRFVSERPADWTPYCRRFIRDPARMPEWPSAARKN